MLQWGAVLVGPHLCSFHGHCVTVSCTVVITVSFNSEVQDARILNGKPL